MAGRKWGEPCIEQDLGFVAYGRDTWSCEEKDLELIFVCLESYNSWWLLEQIREVFGGDCIN